MHYWVIYLNGLAWVPDRDKYNEKSYIEVDIMEAIGSSPKVINGTCYPGGDGVTPDSYQKVYMLGENNYQDYHVYGVEKTENSIDFYVDGVNYFSCNRDVTEHVWEYGNRTMHIILNLAIGGDIIGNPDDSTVFPASMYVDWIKVYQNGTANIIESLRLNLIAFLLIFLLQ